MRLRLAFAGTPAFAVPVLRAVAEAGHAVVRVVTQPDRPAGRGLLPKAPPVKELALALGLEVWQPERPQAQEWLQALGSGLDALVVAAYAYRIPPEVLALPRFGCINVHPSLLPRWRGAAPVPWAILAGDRISGVTIMQMDEGWDTGPILLQRTEPIRPDDTGESLQQRLANLGARLIVEALARLEAGTLAAVPQDPSLATAAPRIRKEDGRLVWAEDAAALERRVRAFAGWPGTYSYLRGRLVRVLAATAAPHEAGGEPGVVLGVDGKRGALRVACGHGVLYLLKVQPEGGRPMSGVDLANGLRLRSGERFEDPGP